MTKTKRKRDDVLTKRNEILIDRDDVNAKCKKVINLFDETITSGADEEKNDDVEFKQKEKKLISFEIVTTTNEKKMMIKRKVSIKSDDFQMFKILDVKNLFKRASAKLVIDDIIMFLNIFKNSSFDSEKFSK